MTSTKELRNISSAKTKISVASMLRAQSTISLSNNDLDPQILSTTITIFIHRLGDALPHGQDHWVWEKPTYDAMISVKCREALPLLLLDLGDNAAILLSCNIMRTYLVHGASGFWFVHQQFDWRGFVGK
jgi:hypothetical protein